MMLRYKVCLLVISSLIVSLNGAATTSSFLSNADRDRLKQVFTSAWELNDLGTVHYSILGYKLLAAPIPNQQAVCKFLLDSVNNGAASLETYFYVTSAWKALGSCSGSLPNTQFIEAATKVLKQDTSSVTDVYYAVNIFKDLGQRVATYVNNIKNSIQSTLKKDDGISNLAYTFHIAILLGNDGAFAFDRIEDAIIQADEVDGRFLQFEGGLSITGLLISGTYKLAQVVNKPPPLSGDQAVKFANYFLSRRSVQTAKGAYNLLDVITILSDNKFHVPVVITLAGPAAVSLAEPKVSVKITDLSGRALSSGPLSVTAESATRMADDVVVLSKKKFEPSPDPMVHSVNLMEVKPEAGLYKISINAVPVKADSRLVGNVGVILPVKVMCSVAVDTFEVGVGDADQTTQPRFERVAYTNKLGRKLEVDSLQKLVIRFSLKDKNSGKSMLVHQAFIRFSNAVTKQEIIFIAEPDSTKTYRFELDVGAKQAEFRHLSGVYSVELIAGDIVISNSFSWNFADVNLKLASDASKSPKAHSLYKPKPIIQHLFREPERRPPVVVSNLFTGLVFVPFLVLIGLWIKLGVNISNFPFSLSAIGFHLGLGAIFILFGLFWLQLNMFQTLKYLLSLGVVTFLCGNKLLAKIASGRKHH